MTTLRTAAQQALEALYEETAWFGPTPKGAAAIAALKAALAQQAEPVARECSDPMCACRGGPCAECEEGEREKEIEDLRSSLYFYQRRCEALQSWQSKMRDPERTIVCDILANGKTLDPAFAGDRYTAPPQKAEPMQEQVIEDAIEAAYWHFDARKKGLNEWASAPQSERDAFKAEARKLVRGYFPTRQAQDTKREMLAVADAFIRGKRAALAQQDEPVQEPVAKVELMTTGGNAGLATRIVEIDDHLRERLRPGQLLYTAPPQRKPQTLDEAMQQPRAMAQAYEAGYKAGVAAEREACAQVCEHQPHWVACAAAIRARGDA